jgi:hypothetical protein
LGPVISNVTHELIGFVPFPGLVRSKLPAPARAECWPD